MKKTDRKNNTKQVVTYPSGLFTIEELNTINSHVRNITLRVRLKNQLKNGLANEVGYLHNNKGRPRSVYVYGPVTEAVITDAKERGMVLKSGLVVDVMSVNKSTETPVDVTINTQVVKEQVAA